jgi:hypothetical protein
MQPLMTAMVQQMFQEALDTATMLLTPKFQEGSDAANDPLADKLLCTPLLGG